MRHIASCLLFVVVLAATAPAQCTNTWLPGQPAGSAAGMDHEVVAIARAADGALLVGGAFTHVGAVPLGHVARFDGVTWQPLGGGVNGTVIAIKQLANGDVLVGGSFSQAGGIAASNIARWNGSTWAPLGTGTNAPVQAIEQLPNGEVVAGGQFTSAGGVAASYVARFDSSGWHAMGVGAPWWVDAIAVRSNGELFLGGFFFNGTSGNAVLRWNGTAFQALPGLGWTTGPPAVRCFAFDRNGDLLAGGLFSVGPYASLARWNGTTWQSLPVFLPYTVNAILPLPDGSLAVAGDFVVASFAGGPTQWMHGFGILTASGWRTFEPGLAQNLGSNGRYVNAVGYLPSGNLLLGGPFPLAGGLPNFGYAVLATDCAPVTVDAGGACASSGGSNTLVATTPPWLGTTFRSLATGLPTNCVTASVFGFVAMSVPMPTVHPQGQPGCTLMVRDDILLGFARGNGTVASEVAIPPVAALLGGVFHHQVVPVELGAASAIVAITATNRLTLTIGAF